MRRWLITGGCGFIGCNLVRHLIADGGHQIRILDSLVAGRRDRLKQVGTVVEVAPEACAADGRAEQIELVVGDIRDADVMRRSTCGRDLVVHLAASTGVAASVQDPRRDCEVNVAGTLNCLDAARHERVARFVFASSGAPVGEVEPPIHEEKAPRPVSPYGASKLAGEGYCSAYARSFGLETVALRFGNVYGPFSDRKSSVVAAFIRQAIAGEPLEIYGDGGQTRDFIYVDDLVRAILKAASAPDVGGEVFQIATAQETGITELAELLTRVLAQYGCKRVRLRNGPPRTGDVRRNFADTSKAARLLGWRAEIALEEGLARVVEWFLREADTGAPISESGVQDRATPAPAAEKRRAAHRERAP
jgi:UDP-glucose 4-epimerase